MAASAVPRRLLHRSLANAPSSSAAAGPSCTRARLHTSTALRKKDEQDGPTASPAKAKTAAKSGLDLWGSAPSPRSSGAPSSPAKSSEADVSAASTSAQAASKRPGKQPKKKPASTDAATPVTPTPATEAAGSASISSTSSSLQPIRTFADLQAQQRRVQERLPGLPSFSMENPPSLPFTHRELVCQVVMHAYAADLQNLTFFSLFCQHAAYAFGLPYARPAPLPTKTSLRTVPRSPFVHKPSQENFVRKEHRREMRIYDADAEVVAQWLQYIQENSMSGVGLKVKLFQRHEVGFGAKMIEGSAAEGGAGSLGGGGKSQDEKVRELAEDLLKSGFGSAGEAAADGSSNSSSNVSESSAAQASSAA